MRIRSIKPEFWRSPDIASLSWDNRLLFIGLWSYVDDSGTGVDREAVIAADLFADDLSRDPRDTLAKVSEGLRTLAESGLIIRFTHQGRDYLDVSTWSRHQRIDKPNKKRFPSSGDTGAEIRDSLATSSRQSHETPAPGAGEQRSRGTGEQGTSSSAKLPAVAEPPREDVEALCTRLRDHIAGNTSKTPTITAKWRTEARLLLDRDEVSIEEAIRVLDWCQQDSFWKSNILSMPKFREKFAGLQIKSHQQSNVSQFPARPTASDRAQAHLDTVEEAVRLMGGGQ